MSDDKYYIISNKFSDVNGMMLGASPRLPSRKDNWMFGQPFNLEPEQPLYIDIQEGEENGTPLSFYRDPLVATNEFIEALIEMGVDNIITYDAILQSEVDPSFTIAGYKAINIIGLVKAAGPGTVYVNDSRNGDASMENTELKPCSIKGLYMFRLAESMRTIVVHEKVKRHLESKGFIGLVFTDTGDALIL